MSKKKQNAPSSILGQIAAWGLLIGLLTLVGVQLARSQQGMLTRGEAAPEFSLTTFDGKEITSEDTRGKVVLLNIWASWCKPCEQEAAALQAAWELYEGRGDVLFLGVDYVDAEPEALAYLERWNVTYPNGPDIGSKIYYYFRARGVPETYLINKAGEIAYIKLGPFQTLEEITTAVDRLLEN